MLDPSLLVKNTTQRVVPPKAPARQYASTAGGDTAPSHSGLPPSVSRLGVERRTLRVRTTGRKTKKSKNLPAARLVCYDDLEHYIWCLTAQNTAWDIFAFFYRLKIPRKAGSPCRRSCPSVSRPSGSREGPSARMDGRKILNISCHASH